MWQSIACTWSLAEENTLIKSGSDTSLKKKQTGPLHSSQSNVRSLLDPQRTLGWLWNGNCPHHPGREEKDPALDDHRAGVGLFFLLYSVIRYRRGGRGVNVIPELGFKNCKKSSIYKIHLHNFKFTQNGCSNNLPAHSRKQFRVYIENENEIHIHEKYIFHWLTEGQFAKCK